MLRKIFEIKRGNGIRGCRNDIIMLFMKYKSRRRYQIKDDFTNEACSRYEK
jgi:hypothetical protein